MEPLAKVCAVALLFSHYFLYRKFNQLKTTMALTNAEILETLQSSNNQVTKLKGDVGFIQTSVTDLKAEVARLKEIIANGGDNSAIAEAVESLATNLQSLDDGIPEIEPTPVPTPTP